MVSDVLPQFEQQRCRVVAVNLGRFEAGSGIDTQVDRVRRAVGNPTIEEDRRPLGDCFVLPDRTLEDEVDEPGERKVLRRLARRAQIGEHQASRLGDERMRGRKLVQDHGLARAGSAGEQLPGPDHHAPVMRPSPSMNSVAGSGSDGVDSMVSRMSLSASKNSGTAHARTRSRTKNTTMIRISLIHAR